MRQMRGKYALITGAGSGIGRAVAVALARGGMNLFLVDIDHSHLTAIAAETSRHGVDVTACTADLGYSSEVSRVVERVLSRFGELDVLVNNAGIAYYGPMHEMSDAQWDRILAVNLHAPIQFTRQLLPVLLRRPEAHIVNVCSIAGLVAGPRLAAYQVSKFGLVGFSESLRAEYGPRGLGVTALCPGLVRTGIFQALMTAPDRRAPRPPWWLCTTPERVAARTVRAIQRNEGLVVVTPLAHLLWGFKRVSPWLLDSLQRFRRHRRHSASLPPVAAEVGSPALTAGAVPSPEDAVPHPLRLFPPLPAAAACHRRAA